MQTFSCRKTISFFARIEWKISAIFLLFFSGLLNFDIFVVFSFLADNIWQCLRNKNTFAVITFSGIKIDEAWIIPRLEYGMKWTEVQTDAERQKEGKRKWTHFHQSFISFRLLLRRLTSYFHVIKDIWAHAIGRNDKRHHLAN